MQAKCSAIHRSRQAIHGDGRDGIANRRGQHLHLVGVAVGRFDNSTIAGDSGSWHSMPRNPSGIFLTER